MSSEYQYDVALVILSLNKLEYTKICLESLVESDYSSFEIIVVDNGSSDGTIDYLKEFDQIAKIRNVGFQLFQFENNAGCSTARNKGVELSRSKYTCFCDNDVALRQKSWLRKMVQFLDDNPNVGMIGPKILYPYEPFNIQCAGAAVTKKGRVQFCGRGESKDATAFQNSKEVQCLISACCMAPTKLLRDVGGMDEVYNPVEFEDIDLCYKIREKGYQVWYVADVEIYHFENVTTEGTPTLPNTYLIVKNGMTFKKRWKHMFEKENGPPEEEAKWKTIEPKRLSDINTLLRIE